MHKIVFVISPPRSVSTALMQSFYNRGDFEIYHENILTANDSRDPTQAEVSKDWYYEDRPTSFQEVKTSILNSAKTKNVLVKEMSFVMDEFLIENADLLVMENVYFVILVRNPADTVVSYANKLEFKDAYKPHIHKWMGYESVYTVMNLCKKAKNKFMVVRSEELTRNPESTLRGVCDYLQLRFKDSMIQWTPPGDKFTGKHEWHETKNTTLVQHWHGSVLQSSNFVPSNVYAKDADGNPLIEKIWLDAYHYSVPWYQKIIES